MTEINGVVKKGKGEATKIGFPTANVHFEGNMGSGIYSGYTFVDGQKYLAALYIGSHNTNIVESHLIDFSPEDLYGKEVKVKFVDKIRDEINNLSMDKLKEIIKNDVQMIKLGLKS
jgi:riboflavin kinase/FMN adenylyltransferase